MRRTLWLGLTLAALGGGTVVAQTVTVPAATIVAARQAGFDLQAGVVNGMKATIDGGGDVKGMTNGAKGLAAWGRAIPGMFPDGTQTGNNTKVRPEAFSDRAGFQKAAENFWLAADKLVTLAEANDKAGFATQYTATTQACGACHRSYQVRNN